MFEAESNFEIANLAETKVDTQSWLWPAILDMNLAALCLRDQSDSTLFNKEQYGHSNA